MDVEIVEAEWDLTCQAGAFKADGCISYVDGFAAALTKSKKAELITGVKECKALEREIKISWS